MEILVNYFTMFVKPEYDQYGNLCSKVYESSGDHFIVDMPPKKFINQSILHYGTSDLNGAINASKGIFGNHRTLPIAICESLGIYCFSTHSVNNLDCAYIFPHHVKDIIELKKRSSIVHFDSDLSVTVHVKKSFLDERTRWTSHLKDTIQIRKESERQFYSITNKSKKFYELLGEYVYHYREKSY
ncbi:competence protein ComK [Bacillaceae bacterium Marseille-Q3522]|nr:competence protein ComK [Bacillaceae bacterium Marseille-Q3522]